MDDTVIKLLLQGKTSPSPVSSSQTLKSRDTKSDTVVMMEWVKRYTRYKKVYYIIMSGRQRRSTKQVCGLRSSESKFVDLNDLRVNGGNGGRQSHISNTSRETACWRQQKRTLFKKNIRSCHIQAKKTNQIIQHCNGLSSSPFFMSHES